jgi:hypothetical protein
VFGAFQQRQFADALARCGDDAAQQVLPVTRQALDGFSFEQIGGVGQLGGKAVAGLVGIQRQVELRGAPFPLHILDTQLRQPRRAAACRGWSGG